MANADNVGSNVDIGTAQLANEFRDIVSETIPIEELEMIRVFLPSDWEGHATLLWSDLANRFNNVHRTSVG